MGSGRFVLRGYDPDDGLADGIWVRRGLIRVWVPRTPPLDPMWDDSELTCARRRRDAEAESSLFDRNRKVETA